MTRQELLDERVKEELSEINMEEAYDNMLDEVHESCELCNQYGASRILKEVDPIAYNCGYSDFIDSQSDSCYELDGEYYEQYEVDEIEAEIIADEEENND